MIDIIEFSFTIIRKFFFSEMKVSSIFHSPFVFKNCAIDVLVTATKLIFFFSGYSESSFL